MNTDASDEAKGERSHALACSEYHPEMVIIRKDWIYAAQNSMKKGIESMQCELEEHDAKYGRDLQRHKLEAEQMERDIETAKRDLMKLNDFTFSHFQNTEVFERANAKNNQ